MAQMPDDSYSPDSTYDSGGSNSYASGANSYASGSNSYASGSDSYAGGADSSMDDGSNSYASGSRGGSSGSAGGSSGYDEDPCAARCPLGCDSSADATKPLCADCVACHNADDCTGYCATSCAAFEYCLTDPDANCENAPQDCEARCTSGVQGTLPI